MAALANATGVAYPSTVSGAIAVDLDIGRRTRRLQPLAVDVAAHVEIVSVLAEPRARDWCSSAVAQDVDRTGAQALCVAARPETAVGHECR